MHLLIRAPSAPIFYSLGHHEVVTTNLLFPLKREELLEQQDVYSLDESLRSPELIPLDTYYYRYSLKRVIGVTAALSALQCVPRMVGHSIPMWAL